MPPFWQLSRGPQTPSLQRGTGKREAGTVDRPGCRSTEKCAGRVGTERPGPVRRAREWTDPERGQPGHWATEFLERKENILRHQPVQSLHAAAGTPNQRRKKTCPRLPRVAVTQRGGKPRPSGTSCALSYRTAPCPSSLQVARWARRDNGGEKGRRCTQGGPRKLTGHIMGRGCLFGTALPDSGGTGQAETG